MDSKLDVDPDHYDAGEAAYESHIQREIDAAECARQDAEAERWYREGVLDHAWREHLRDAARHPIARWFHAEIAPSLVAVFRAIDRGVYRLRARFGLLRADEIPF